MRLRLYNSKQSSGFMYYLNPLWWSSKKNSRVEKSSECDISACFYSLQVSKARIEIFCRNWKRINIKVAWIEPKEPIFTENVKAVLVFWNLFVLSLDDKLARSFCNASKKLVDICSQQKIYPIALQMACLTLYVVSFQCINTKKQAQLDQNISRFIFFTTKVFRPRQARQRQARQR